LFGCWWGEDSTEDPGGQYRSDEGADPVNIELLPCVVPFSYICPPKGLWRTAEDKLQNLLDFQTV